MPPVDATVSALLIEDAGMLWPRYEHGMGLLVLILGVIALLAAIKALKS